MQGRKAIAQADLIVFVVSHSKDIVFNFVQLPFRVGQHKHLTRLVFGDDSGALYALKWISVR